MTDDSKLSNDFIGKNYYEYINRGFGKMMTPWEKQLPEIQASWILRAKAAMKREKDE